MCRLICVLCFSHATKSSFLLTTHYITFLHQSHFTEMLLVLHNFSTNGIFSEMLHLRKILLSCRWFWLIVFIFYVPDNNISVMSWRFLVFSSRTCIKQRIKCLTQGHSTGPPMSLELATPKSQVFHSTTELLHSSVTGFTLLVNKGQHLKCHVLHYFSAKSN